MKPPFAYQERTETLPLAAALLIYGNRYVTRHDIVRTRPGAPQLGPGQPITRASLARLLAAAGRDAGMSGWVDLRVLYIGPELVVWHSPPQIRTMFFACGRDKEAGSLRDRAGPAPQPALVWAVKSSGWYVWAIHDGLGRPTPATPLYQAPYLNVYEDGGICTGNAAVPRQVSTEVLDGFEQAFFDSRFTHANTQDLTTHQEGIYALWEHLLDGFADPQRADPCTFPAATLVSLNMTLGDVVRQLTKEPDHDRTF